MVVRTVGGTSADAPTGATGTSCLSGEHASKASRRQRATGAPVKEIGVDSEGEPRTESRPDKKAVAVPTDMERSAMESIGTMGGGGKIVDVVVVRNLATAPEPIGNETSYARSARITESKADEEPPAAAGISSSRGRPGKSGSYSYPSSASGKSKGIVSADKAGCKQLERLIG